MTRFLAACRFLLIIPVIGCVLLTAGVVIVGMGRIITVGVNLVRVADFTAKGVKAMSLAVIEIIDLFLIGTVTYVIVVGAYKLFIRGTGIELPMRIRINSLNDLENLIIGLLVAAPGAAFLGQAIGSEAPSALLNYGGGSPWLSQR